MARAVSELAKPAPVELAPGQSWAVALTAHRRPLHALTGIRFFAAMLVVIFHSRLGAVLSSHGFRAAGQLFANGFLAVPLFFLLSGFILAYTYEGQLERPGDSRRFWEARFARIWPVYVVALLAASIPSGHHPQPVAMLGTLLMLQAWSPFSAGLAGAWNPVCWTLSVEALFYVCFPPVQRWLERRGTRAQLLWTATMLLLCVGFDTGARTLGYAPERPLQVPLPVWHLPEFFAGVGLGDLFLRRLAVGTMRSPGAPLLPGRGLFTYAALLLSLVTLCRPPYGQADRWLSLAIPALAALLFGLAAERTLLSRLLSTPLLVLGGGISYSIYLFQFPVREWILAATAAVHLRSENLRMVLVLVVLLGWSWLMFTGVENPARRVLRRIFAALEARRAARASTPLGDGSR